MDVNFIKNIAAHISSVPPLPAAAQKLIQLTSMQNVDIQEITQVIAMDQGIASKLLQVVNSPFYGLQKKVNTIPQAITFLGLDAIKSLALSVSMIKRSNDQKGAQYFTQEEFWKHSLSTAIFSKNIAHLLKYEDPEEAFIAGLMHDIGKLILLEFTGENYLIALAQASKTERGLHFYEREIFEIDHALLGEELCRHWMIPEKISKAIGLHHQALLNTIPGEDKEVICLGAVVSVANQISHLLHFGKSGNGLVSSDALQYLLNRKIDFETLLKTIQSARKEMSDSASMFGFKADLAEINKDKIALSLSSDLEKMMFKLMWAETYNSISDFDEDKIEEFQLVVYDKSFSEEKINQLKALQIKTLNFGEWKEKHQPAEFPVFF